MDNYQIYEGVKAQLKKVTPYALKALNKKGLYSIAEQDVLESLRKIMTMLIDEQQLFELMDIIFVYNKQAIKNPDEIDIAEVMSGYRSFFFQLERKPS